MQQMRGETVVSLHASTHAFLGNEHEKQLRFKATLSKRPLHIQANVPKLPRRTERRCTGLGSSASYSGATSLNPISFPPPVVAVMLWGSLNRPV